MEKHETNKQMKETFEEFIQLLEKASGKTRKELGFKVGASQKELDKLETEIKNEFAEAKVEFPTGALDNLKALLSVVSGQDETLSLWGAPLLSIDELLDEYPGYIDDDTNDFYDEYQDEDKVRCLIYHESRVPFASYPAELHFMLDFDPGPEGKAGQVIWNTSECDYEVLADNLNEFFQLYNKGIKAGFFKIVEVEGYDHTLELTWEGKPEYIGGALEHVRGFK